MIKKRHLIKGFQSSVLSLFLLMASNLGVNAQSWPAGAHDPSSIVKDGDTYWTFTTGDAIPSLYSTDLVTWSAGPSVFPRVGGAIDYPKWINTYAPSNSGNFWAPDVFYMDSAYYLYYSASEWGTMSSTIGVVKTKSLNPSSPDYNWVDQGDIDIYSSHPDHVIGGVWTVNAIDASVIRGHDGKIWLLYGSFNKGGIMVTQVDSTTGKPFGARTSIANSYTGTVSGYHEGEGAGMFYRDGYYYLVYNKGGCCAGINSSYYMVIGRSTSPTGPFVDKNGVNMKATGSASGGTVFFKHDDAAGMDDRYYGPGHFEIFTENGVDYFSFHYYDPNGPYGQDLGRPTLGLGLLEWGEEGWPTVSFDFIEDGVYSLTNVNSGKALDLENHADSEGARLWQSPFDSTLNTQKWLFTAVGNGEYTIQNYSNFSHVKTNDQTLTTEYTPAPKINEKYRVAKGTDGKILVYPTTRDEVFEIPNAYTVDYQVKLWWNTNHACQRWTLTPWDLDVNFSSTYSDIDLGFNDSTFLSDISITTDGAWSIKFEDDSWLETETITGEGDFSDISIHASFNPTKAARTNKLFICSHTGEIDTVDVTQAANTSIVFAVDIENIELDYKDTSFVAFNITTNVPWNISYEISSWIEATPASGDADVNITVHASENSTNAERTNKIYINSASGEVYTINITQAGKPIEIFTVDTDSIELDYKDTSFVAFNITTNMAWNITFETDSWIEATPASGDADENINVNAYENTTYVERTNKIYIHSASGQVYTVNVTQAAHPTPSGISDNRYLDHLKVYPNPSSGKVFVEVADEAKVNVYNSLGQQMLSTVLINAKNKIDISHFEPGLYIFEIVINNTRTQHMVIKQ